MKLTTMFPAFAKVALLAAFTNLPASASAMPNFGNLFHRTPKVAAPPMHVLSFRNASFQPRELEVGDESYRLGPQSKLLLRVSEGAPVKVKSPVNSHVHGVVAVSTPAASAKEIVVE